MGVSNYDGDDTTLKGPDGTVIGNVGDKLKTVSKKDNEDFIDTARLECLLEGLTFQLKVANTHLAYITDLELDEGDEEG